MKVTYLKLKNVAGLKVGSDLDEIEIDFANSVNKIVGIIGKNGNGKALPNSTKIPTPDGYKLMGDIVPGDYVFNWRGEPVKVLDVFPQGKKDVYEVEFSYGKKSKCCEEHLWEYYYNSHGFNTRNVATLKDIMSRYGSDDMGIRIRNNRAVKFNHQNIPIDPYVLGVFIGNGCCREGALTISCIDDEIPKKICRIYDFEYRKNSDHTYSYNFKYRDGKSVRTKDFFRNIPSMINAYSYEKFIPKEYLYNNESVRWDLLRGLIDTDGSVSADSKRPGKFAITYSTTSRQLCDDITFLVRSLGLNTTILYDTRVEKYSSGFCATIRIIGNLQYMMDRICSVGSKYSKLFNCVTSKEYRNKSFNQTYYEYNYFRKITKLNYQEDMTCILVDDPDHLFLTEDFVVTHNSVLLSTITPFAYTTALDERSTLPLILVGKDGYKEIRYVNGPDVYVIKHYYKASKDTHSVKSYFAKNGEELNENGNVTSFNELVEMHFGLTQEMMRLVRIGTNVNSFITLSPAKRKEYIGKLIEEIDLYMSIYKKINEDIRVIKTMLQANNTNLYNCHISDIVVEEEKLSDYIKTIKRYEKERDQIVAKISKINALIQDNDIDDLRRKQNEAQASLNEFARIESLIESKNLTHTTLEELIALRSKQSNDKLDAQSRINSYRLAIDSVYTNIERIEAAIKRITSDNDLQSLTDSIKILRDNVEHTHPSITNFIYLGSTSEEVFEMLTKLQSLNQISNMILTFGDRAISTYLKLRQENKSVTAWLKEQSRKKMSNINTDDIRALLTKVFQDDMIITPNCDTEYTDCPFYRFHEVISDFRDKMEEETYDDETLNYINIINNNIYSALNELDRMEKVHIPDSIRLDFTESKILDRMKNKLTFFNLDDLESYLALLREYEIYKLNCEKLSQYEHQLSMYRKSGVDGQLEEIKHQKDQINVYNTEITKLQGIIDVIDSRLQETDANIALLTKHQDGLKYKKMFESTLESTQKILKPLENAAQERSELNFSLQQITNLIDMSRDNHRTLEAKINEYNRLVKEGKKLAKKNKDLNIIQEAVSTKKGIPVIYMKRYLGKIQSLANSLLSIIYDGEFQLAQFNVTTDTFEVPYIKNGRKIPDIKYASQSELALGTMALSFALSNNSTGNYNILLLDEIDAGLDGENRAAFLQMLYHQMEVIHSEQVFIISHNLSQMINIPMDCIKLSDTDVRSKLQNVIYEK